MEIISPILDRIYPKLVEKNAYRTTARAILINEKQEIYLLHISCEDIFGKRDHYELPGGGVNPNEDFIDALKREMLEETGYQIKDIHYLGEAAIEYNLLKRIDVGTFYVCHTSTKEEKHLEEYEKEIFTDSIWVPIRDILSFYDSHPAITVGGMIHKRDRAVIEYALKMKLLGE